MAAFVQTPEGRQLWQRYTDAKRTGAVVDTPAKKSAASQLPRSVVFDAYRAIAKLRNPGLDEASAVLAFSATGEGVELRQAYVDAPIDDRLLAKESAPELPLAGLAEHINSSINEIAKAHYVGIAKAHEYTRAPRPDGSPWLPTPTGTRRSPRSRAPEKSGPGRTAETDLPAVAAEPRAAPTVGTLSRR